MLTPFLYTFASVTMNKIQKKTVKRYADNDEPTNTEC